MNLSAALRTACRQSSAQTATDLPTNPSRILHHSLKNYPGEIHSGIDFDVGLSPKNPRLALPKLTPNSSFPGRSGRKSPNRLPQPKRLSKNHPISLVTVRVLARVLVRAHLEDHPGNPAITRHTAAAHTHRLGTATGHITAGRARTLRRVGVVHRRDIAPLGTETLVGTTPAQPPPPQP